MKELNDERLKIFSFKIDCNLGNFLESKSRLSGTYYCRVTQLLVKLESYFPPVKLDSRKLRISWLSFLLIFGKYL